VLGTVPTPHNVAGASNILPTVRRNLRQNQQLRHHRPRISV
jgi:hypothetical protein